ncbi:HofO family protein, partial [Escherichia coli]
TLILRLTGSAEARIDAVLLQAEQQLARSLQITKPRLLEQQQLREQRSQRQRQRQFTRDWQSALEALAALLPEHAWLTTISWQQGTLEIKGLTTSITALNALETSLCQDAFFHLNQRGGTGGELALKTLWEAVPSAFTRLAERNVSVSRFSLSVEGDDLLFTLQLETPHEG